MDGVLYKNSEVEGQIVPWHQQKARSFSAGAVTRNYLVSDIRINYCFNYITIIEVHPKIQEASEEPLPLKPS